MTNRRCLAFVLLLPFTVSFAPGCKSESPPRTLRILPVEVPVPTEPSLRWPDEVDAIGMIALDAPEGGKNVHPGAADFFKAELGRRLVERFPEYKFHDRANLEKVLEENPGGKIPALDAVFDGKLSRARFVPGVDGGGTVEVGYVLRLIGMMEGQLLAVPDLVQLHHAAVLESHQRRPGRSPGYQAAAGSREEFQYSLPKSLLVFAF